MFIPSNMNFDWCLRSHLKSILAVFIYMGGSDCGDENGYDTFFVMHILGLKCFLKQIQQFK